MAIEGRPPAGGADGTTACRPRFSDARDAAPASVRRACCSPPTIWRDETEQRRRCAILPAGAGAAENARLASSRRRLQQVRSTPRPSMRASRSGTRAQRPPRPSGRSETSSRRGYFRTMAIAASDGQEFRAFDDPRRRRRSSSRGVRRPVPSGTWATRRPIGRPARERDRQTSLVGVARTSLSEVSSESRRRR